MAKAVKLSDGRVIHEDDYFELGINTSDAYWYLICDPKTNNMVDHYCTKKDFDELLAFLKNPERKRLTIDGDSWTKEGA